MSGKRFREISAALERAAVRCENAELRVQILEKMIAEAAMLSIGIEDRLWSDYEISHPLRVQRLKYRRELSETEDSSMMLGIIKHSVAVSHRLIDDGMGQLTGVADSIDKLALAFEQRDELRDIPDLSKMTLEQLAALKQELREDAEYTDDSKHAAKASDSYNSRAADGHEHITGARTLNRSNHRAPDDHGLHVGSEHKAIGDHEHRVRDKHKREVSREHDAVSEVSEASTHTAGYSSTKRQR